MKRILILLLPAAVSLLTGCQSTEFTPSTPVTTQRAGDIEFELRYVSEKETREVYGDDYNPFYNYPGKLPRKQFFYI